MSRPTARSMTAVVTVAAVAAVLAGCSAAPTPTTRSASSRASDTAVHDAPDTDAEPTPEGPTLAEPAPLDVVFPDPALAECVSQGLDRAPLDITISQTTLDHVTDPQAKEAWAPGIEKPYAEYGVEPLGDEFGWLSCHDRIRNPEGMQYLRKLGFLNLEQGVEDLAPIGRMTALRILYVNEDDFEGPHSATHDLSPLSSLQNLDALALEGVKSDDFSVLSSLPSLVSLSLRESSIRDLDVVATLSKLRELDITGTQVTDLTPVEPVVAFGQLKVWGP